MSRADELWRNVRPTVAFLLAWAALNTVANLRYPAADPGFWYLLPALDVVVLFGSFAVLGFTGRELPRALRWLLVALFLCARLLRVGDGVQQRYFDSQFNLYFDVPLIPELFRLMHSTFPLWKFALLVLALAGGLVALCFGIGLALKVSEKYLRRPRHVALFAALSAAALVVPTPSAVRGTDWFAARSVTASALPRIGTEISFLAQAAELAEHYRQNIRDLQSELQRTPQDLAGLQGQDVFLFVVESYGRAAFDQPRLAHEMQSRLRTFEARAADHGFATASAWLESPTYGGRSWLAHATLSTGVQIADQLAYQLLLRSQPLSLAHFFRRAGYRAVLAQPGTTRPFREGDAYGFDEKYYAWHFGYAGPRFSWAPMPDQFVIDFVHRREVERRAQPLFIEYALVSSHTPWDLQPPLVEDWKNIGNGAVYQKLPPVRFDVQWPELNDAAPAAYVRALAYDFDVLQRYLADFVRGDALIVILGDHQPPRQVTQSDSHDVPVHVISRRRVFVDAFLARGYTQGMFPKARARRSGMRQFLPELLRTFSSNTQEKG